MLWFTPYFYNIRVGLCKGEKSIAIATSMEKKGGGGAKKVLKGVQK